VRDLGLGLGVLLALLTPYLVGQALNGFQDLKAAAASGAAVRAHGLEEGAGLLLGVVLASPEIVAGMPALHATCCPALLLALHRGEAWLLVLGLVFAIVTAGRRGERDRAQRAVVVVALGFAIPLMMLLGAQADVKPHYFDVAYPMPFVAAALALSRGVEGIGRLTGARARRALSAALAGVVALTVVLQVGFHRQVWRAIRATGAAVWTPGELEVMPIRYKAELARILTRDFGARSSDVVDRLHGSRARDWLEDGGYFLDRARSQVRPGGAPGSDPALHYAIVWDERGGAPPSGRRTARAGAYRVAEYRPRIDYSTWRCAAGASAAAADRTPARWPVEVSRPAAGDDPKPWTLACWGMVSGPAAAGEPLRIVVSLRGRRPGPFEVEALLVNGEAVAAERTRGHATFAAYTVDAVFDVSRRLRPGANEAVVRMRTAAPALGVDVYEIGG
jgi:hypothetical protein